MKPVRRIRDEQHVGLVDLLEATDRRAVKAKSGLEVADVKRRERERHVLPHAGQIDELQIHHLDAAFSGELEHFRCRLGAGSGGRLRAMSHRQLRSLSDCINPPSLSGWLVRRLTPAPEKTRGAAEAAPRPCPPYGTPSVSVPAATQRSVPVRHHRHRSPAPGSLPGSRVKARPTGTPRGRVRPCRRSPCSPATSAMG